MALQVGAGVLKFKTLSLHHFSVVKERSGEAVPEGAASVVRRIYHEKV